jgi:hypothetical protein
VCAMKKVLGVATSNTWPTATDIFVPDRG